MRLENYPKIFRALREQGGGQGGSQRHAEAGRAAGLHDRRAAHLDWRDVRGGEGVVEVARGRWDTSCQHGSVTCWCRDADRCRGSRARQDGG